GRPAARLARGRRRPRRARLRARGARGARRRLAAQARPLRAGDERPRRVRRGRRPGAIDQAGRKRGGRGVDGRVADPRVPGERMSTTAVSVTDLRPIDLFDELDDEELARWAAVTQIREFRAGDVIAEQGQHAQAMYLVLEGTVQALLVNEGRIEPTGQHRAELADL